MACLRCHSLLRYRRRRCAAPTRTNVDRSEQMHSDFKLSPLTVLLMGSEKPSCCPDKNCHAAFSEVNPSESLLPISASPKLIHDGLIVIGEFVAPRFFG